MIVIIVVVVNVNVNVFGIVVVVVFYGKLKTRPGTDLGGRVQGVCTPPPPLK